MNAFTEESVRRMEAVKRQSAKSIHPFGRRDKANTSKAKSQGTIARLRAAIEGHLRRHPRDGVAAGHLAKLAA